MTIVHLLETSEGRGVSQKEWSVLIAVQGAVYGDWDSLQAVRSILKTYHQEIVLKSS